MDLMREYNTAFFFGYTKIKSDFYLENLNVKEKIILETDKDIVDYINSNYDDVKIVQDFDNITIDKDTLIIINDTFHIIYNSTTDEEKQDLYNHTKDAGGYIIEDLLPPSDYMTDSELLDLPVDESEWEDYLDSTKFYEKYNMLDVSCDFLAKTYNLIKRDESMSSFYYSTPWKNIRDQLAAKGYKLVYHCDYTDEKIKDKMREEYDYDVNIPTNREAYFLKF